MISVSVWFSIGLFDDDVKSKSKISLFKRKLLLLPTVFVLLATKFVVLQPITVSSLLTIKHILSSYVKKRGN
jgi:UDP-N-acetylmuramyl pentapeptide phosphotransferase/UDP-N-acetylglucosamine-1-phosphate transferase